MFAPSVGVGELMLRVAIVYVAIFVLLLSSSARSMSAS